MIQPDEPASVEIYEDRNGQRFYFCCESCRRDFLSDPSRFDGGLALEITDAADDQESSLWNSQADAYAFTFWGRVGRVVIVVDKAADWVSNLLFLKDPLSRLLATATALLVFGTFLVWARQWYRGVSLRPNLSIVFGAVLLLIPTFYADRSRHQLTATNLALAEAEAERDRLKKQKQDMHDRDMIHYATFLNYGNPPIPRPSELPASLRKTYYRGNDERSDEMPNGGNYRTVTFELWIEDAEGNVIRPDDRVDGPRGDVLPLFLVVKFIRAPGTSSGYFTDDYMKRMYVTMETGDFLGRDEPVRDRVSWERTNGEEVWTARYPIPEGTMVWETNDGDLDAHRVRRLDASHRYDRGGVVYLCEDRFEQDRLIGGRFHYAIEYSIRTDQGVVRADSDLWMQATYRGRNFAKLQIEDEHWLSFDPIPEKR